MFIPIILQVDFITYFVLLAYNQLPLKCYYISSQVQSPNHLIDSSPYLPVADEAWHIGEKAVGDCVITQAF